MYTGYHNVHRCFEETLSEGEQHFSEGERLMHERVCSTTTFLLSGTSSNHKTSCVVVVKPGSARTFLTRLLLSYFPPPGRERAKWIRVHGSWLPRHINGRLHALFANLRCLWATVSLFYFMGRHQKQVVVSPDRTALERRWRLIKTQEMIINVFLCRLHC